MNTRVSLNTLRPPIYFPIIPEGGRVAGFWHEGGLSCKVLGREAPENGAESAMLESFSDFLVKLLLKNSIKSKKMGMLGLDRSSCFFEDLFLKTAIISEIDLI